MYWHNNFDLSIEELVKELDREQLVVLTFLTSRKTNEELDELFSVRRDLSILLSIIRADKLDKKISQKDAEKIIRTNFEWLKGKNEIYVTFLKHCRHEPVLHLNSAVYGLYQFVRTITDDKIVRFMSKIPTFSKKKEDVFSQLDHFKNFIGIEGKPLLSSLIFLYFLARVEDISGRFEQEGLTNLIQKEGKDLERLKDTTGTIKEVIHSWYFSCIHEHLVAQMNTKEMEKRNLQFKLEKQEKMNVLKEENMKKLKEKNRSSLLLEKEKNETLIKEIHDARYQLETIEEKWEEKYSVLRESFENEQRELSIANGIIKTKDEQICSLKKEIKTNAKKAEENRERELKPFLKETPSFHEWLQVGKTFFSEVPKNEYEKNLGLFLESFGNKMERQVVVPEILVPTPIEKNRIGYCIIENNCHMVVFPNGEKLEILEFSPSIYLQQYQFVLISPKGQLLKNFPFAFLESARDYSIYQYGITRFKDDGVYVQLGDNSYTLLEKVPQSTKLREGQIVSMDSKNQYIRFYFPLKTSLDGFIDSMNARAQTPYVLIRKLSDGQILRNIITGEENFFKLDSIKEWDVEERQIVLLKGEELCQVFRQPKFYTLSSFYQHAEHANVKKIEGDTVFIEKNSGEIVMLLEKPSHVELQVGQVLKIDEHHNYLHLEHSVYMDGALTDERKKLAKLHAQPRIANPSAPIEVNKDVLIIGKITHEFNYKAVLLKHGFRTNVVDGYEPWIKIKQASKNKDVIVVVEDYISHDNMFRIREEFPKEAIVYSERDGANFIAEKVKTTI